MESTLCKVAGFVDESLQINTSQAIWDFYFFQHESKNRTFKDRTCKSGLTSLQIRICKDSGFGNPDFKGFILCYIVLKIREDLLVSWKQVGSMKICLICNHKSNPQTKYYQNSKNLNLQTFLELGFVIMIWYESMDLQATGTRFPGTNPTTLALCNHFGCFGTKGKW